MAKRRRGPRRSRSRASSSGTTTSYAEIDNVVVRAVNSVAYTTDFGAAGATPLYVDASGRLTTSSTTVDPSHKVITSTNTAAIIPVYESQLVSFKQIVTVQTLHDRRQRLAERPTTAW